MKGRVLITVFLLLTVVLLTGCGAQGDAAAAADSEYQSIHLIMAVNGTDTGFVVKTRF